MKYLKNILFAAAAILIACIQGCDIKNPVDGVAVVLNQKDIATTVALSFVDASTGMQIVTNGNDAIKIEFTGKDKESVVSLKELPLAESSTKNGIVSFAISNSRTPTKQNPVEFNVLISANGYSSVSQNIIIDKTGSNPFQIAMVNLSSPPEGAVVTDNQAIPSSNGQVTTEVSVSTEDEALTNCSSSIILSPGTALRDQDGNAVSGALSATISYFNNRSHESLKSFPGGLIAKAKTKSGAVSRGLFSTAGFAEFTIKNQAGKEVKSFGNAPAEFSIDIPTGTFNKETNSSVKNGDVVPVWSYDESAASWIYETSGTAQGPDARGNFRVSFTGNHLSWWNIGWLGENVCSEGATINLNGNYASLRLDISDLNGNFISSEIVSSTESSVTVRNAPAGIPVKIEAFDNLACSNNKVGEVTAADLCGQEVNMNITAPGSNVTVTVEAFCANRDPVLRVRPSIDIYIVNECGQRINAGKMVDGFIVLKSLNVGSSYVLGVYYDDDDNPATDNWHQSDPQLVDKTNFDFNYELDASICDDL